MSKAPLKGAPPLITKISTFTQEKWDKCVATGHRWQCPGQRLADAQQDDVSRAVCHYLELQCARKLLRHQGKDADSVDDPIAAAAQ